MGEKTTYEAPDLEVINFDAEPLGVSGGNGGGIELPDHDW